MVEKPKECPDCGSTKIEADGDFIETDPSGFDGHFYGWWQCMDCGKQWRYRDPTLNPD